jgi:hypothetical protein
LAGNENSGNRAGQMYDSEIMIILIHFHQAQHRTFKAYYTEHVRVHLQGEFPRLVSYSRFVELMPQVVALLCGYLRSRYEWHCAAALPMAVRSLPFDI